MPLTFVKELDEVFPTFIHFSSHEWKFMKFSWYLTIFISHFNNIYLLYSELLQNLMKVMRFYESWLYFMKLTKFDEFIFGIILCFHSFWRILLTIAFPVGAFKSWLQNFGSIWTDSKFWNFRLGNGKSLKKSISQLPTSVLLPLWVQNHFFVFQRAN